MILHNFDLFQTNTIYLFIIISYIALILLSFNRQRADRLSKYRIQYGF